MNRDKRRDLYIFCRRELEIVLQQLCDIIDDLKKLLNEERLFCESWDVDEQARDDF